MKGIEIRLDKGSGYLAGPIRTVIHKNYHVTVFHLHGLRSLWNYRRCLNELISFPAGIGQVQPGFRAFQPAFLRGLGEPAVGPVRQEILDVGSDNQLSENECDGDAQGASQPPRLCD